MCTVLAMLTAGNPTIGGIMSLALFVIAMWWGRAHVVAH